MEEVALQQQHQELLQQQLHRAQLELAAAHQRITKNDEATALLEVKLEDSEFKQKEAKRKHAVEMDEVAVDLQEIEASRAQAAAEVSDLRQWVTQQGQQLAQVVADLSRLQQQQQQQPQQQQELQLPPPLAQDPDTQARAGPGQEPRVTSRVTSKSAQSPGPPTTSAAGHLFTHSHSSLNCLLPSSPQQCQCSSAAATLPAPAKSKMLPPGGAGVPPRAFPSVGLTIVVGLAILGGLWIPSALASTVVTSSPPTTVADSRTPGGEVHPPPGSTGSGARDRPVSPAYSLKALRCPASTARLYPVDTVCGVSREPQDEPFPSSQSIRRKAFLLQRDMRQEIDLWRCNKRTSSRSIHCGFQS